MANESTSRLQLYETGTSVQTGDENSQHISLSREHLTFPTKTLNTRLFGKPQQLASACGESTCKTLSEHRVGEGCQVSGSCCSTEYSICWQVHEGYEIPIWANRHMVMDAVLMYKSWQQPCTTKDFCKLVEMLMSSLFTKFCLMFTFCRKK